jgi:hypothetical protein
MYLIVKLELEIKILALNIPPKIPFSQVECNGVLCIVCLKTCNANSG